MSSRSYTGRGREGERGREREREGERGRERERELYYLFTNKFIRLQDTSVL